MVRKNLIEIPIPVFRSPLRQICVAVWAAMLLFVVYHSERFLIEPENPIWNEFEPVKWRLLIHGLAGAAALLVGPLQFSTSLRQRYLQAHRLVGRCYVGAVIVAAPTAIWISHTVDTPILHAA